ncbi:MULTISPECIES: hypothetical protein [unclassified Bacillus (in: firmicutes)]|uniref:hypothetical protein n=1 Tax=unclassified Bacillus (in: firmicutes) TaxID=185979 RepID=UPI0008DF5819|nr:MULTISPECIES: hypothetical protein [unclassified Bacillus (in: firmicutes)]SFA69879.1 hypothetical protein SAMN02799634_10162 [Bacillus sp. UNCCL13]SFQ59258.1 hypothetical protein SAMN04488577_0346 [Bacillus sp. cl95]
MDEKQVWKWILEKFSDESIAELGRVSGIKVPGFRQISVQHNFKILRPRLISALVNSKNMSTLKDYYDPFSDEADELKGYRDKSVEELLTLVETEIKPSALILILLSGEHAEHIDKAIEIYSHLSNEGTLDVLEKKYEENEGEGVKSFEEDSSTILETKNLKAAQTQMKSLEKKLKKAEQKNESMKATSLQDKETNEKLKKQWKEEKKTLNLELHQLKTENGKLAAETSALNKEKQSFLSEKESLKKTKETLQLENTSLKNEVEQLKNTLKEKDAEISRLHALCLHLRKAGNQPLEEQNDEMKSQSKTKIHSGKTKIAIVGNPKNTKVNQNGDYDLVIVDANEVENQIHTGLFEQTEQIWLLTYRTPIKAQRRIKSAYSDKTLREFATFVDLENFMLKG